MKKRIFYIGLLSLMGLFAVSCGPSAEEKEEARVRRSKTPNLLTWDTIFVKKTEPLDSKLVTASATIDIDFIVPKEYENQEILDEIKGSLNYATLGEDDSYRKLSADEAINNFSSTYLANYKKETTNQLAMWHKINGGDVFSYSTTIKTDVLYDEANLISYQISITEKSVSDSLATINVKNIIFDLTDAKSLKEQDIFEQGYGEKLNQALIKQILKKNDLKDIEELQELGYWGVADIAANNNFYITKDGITYVFNPDEYSDAKLGVLEVFLDFDDIKDILKKESPISILLED